MSAKSELHQRIRVGVCYRNINTENDILAILEEQRSVNGLSLTPALIINSNVTVSSWVVIESIKSNVSAIFPNTPKMPSFGAE